MFKIALRGPHQKIATLKCDFFPPYQSTMPSNLVKCHEKIFRIVPFLRIKGRYCIPKLKWSQNSLKKTLGCLEYRSRNELKPSIKVDKKAQILLQSDKKNYKYFFMKNM